jgi:hypothetical protein
MMRTVSVQAVTGWNDEASGAPKSAVRDCVAENL